MDTILTIHDTDLERFNSQSAVELFRRLLHAEARRVGLPISKVHISTWTTVPDGGVDAYVEPSDPSVIDDLIKKGRTSYQLKSSRTFYPWQPSQLKKELFGGKPPTKENLGTEIKKCFDENGNYVLVNSSANYTEEQRKKAVKKITALIEGCGYENPSVEVWGQTELIGFLGAFPALALAVNGQGGAYFETHDTWASQATMSVPLKLGPAQQETIKHIQDGINNPAETEHIRVLGEAGIGKTRLALEATRSDYLRPQVIYTKPATILGSDLLRELQTNPDLHCILVVDECDSRSRAELWDRLQPHRERIQLLSIFNEQEASTAIAYFYINRLEDEYISQILQEYQVPEDAAQRWVPLCDGSPRVAHILGRNLQTNPEDLLRPPGEVDVWPRFIAGYDDPKEASAKERFTVLKYLALFRRFGYERPVNDEAKNIHNLIKQNHPEIGWGRFQEIISELRQMHILQGEKTLYITPRLLHVYLWTEWWETYGDSTDVTELLGTLLPELRDWFIDMVKYAGQSKAAETTLSKLFGTGGAFEGTALIQTLEGSRFFLALAEASPGYALDALEKAIAHLSVEELEGIENTRSNIVWGLQRIVIWQDYFVRGAKLLLKLAEAENQVYSNNATGIFTNLFTLAYGRLAPTEAPPEMRFPLLTQIFEQESSTAQRLIGLKAIEEGLRAGNFVRAIGAEYQGLRKEPDLWKPQKWKEVFDGYRRYWKLLIKVAKTGNTDERSKAVSIISNEARGLLRIQAMSSEIFESLLTVHSEGLILDRTILKILVDIKRYDEENLLPEIKERLDQIIDELTNKDFHSKLNRYVGMNLFSDQVDREGKQTGELTEKLKELAQYGLQHTDELGEELDWLASDSAENGYLFGYELGKLDKTRDQLKKILEAYTGKPDITNVFFLSGYLRAVFEYDTGIWEQILDELMDKDAFAQWLPEITQRTGFSENAILRLIGLAEKGTIPAHQLSIFTMRGETALLTEATFHRLLKMLLDSGEAVANSVMLELFHEYYISKKSNKALPRTPAKDLLLNDFFFTEPENPYNSTMDSFYWRRTAEAFVEQYPEESIPLAEKIISHFDQRGPIVSSSGRDARGLLTEILRRNPEEVWEIIKKQLENPYSGVSFYLFDWLRGSDWFGQETPGAFRLIPKVSLYDWIDEDLKERAPLIARNVPKKLYEEDGSEGLARDILAKYGESQDVRNEMSANFSTEGWTGSRTTHFTKKIKQLEAIRTMEGDSNVLQWLDEYIGILEEDLERAILEEERGRF